MQTIDYTINTNTDLENLHSKFHPFLLGHKLCKVDQSIKDKVDKIFENFDSLETLNKDYIFTADEWIVKGARTDGSIPMVTPDSHLFRVRKTEKIRQFIEKNGLGGVFIVPKEYIYWREKTSKFYVISEKIELSNTFASFANPEDEEVLKNAGQLSEEEEALKNAGKLSQEEEEALKEAKESLIGQLKVLTENFPKHDLTLEQAKALAKLCLATGYTNFNYTNLRFALDGKIAIIDTEPKKRWLKKGRFAALTFPHWKNKDPIIGIGKLKLFLKDPVAFKEVEKIENKHAIWSAVKNFARIIPPLLIFLAIDHYTKKFRFRKVINVINLTCYFYKFFSIMARSTSFLDAQHFSNRGLEGMMKNEKYEKKIWKKRIEIQKKLNKLSGDYEDLKKSKKIE